MFIMLLGLCWKVIFFVTFDALQIFCFITYRIITVLGTYSNLHIFFFLSHSNTFHLCMFFFSFFSYSLWHKHAAMFHSQFQQSIDIGMLSRSLHAQVRFIVEIWLQSHLLLWESKLQINPPKMFYTRDCMFKCGGVLTHLKH